MDTNTALEKLGFTRNEINVYTYLLRKGASKGLEIYTENHLDKSSAYKALSALVTKGVIEVSGESRNQIFKAKDSKQLNELLTQKKREFDEAELVIKNFSKELDEYLKKNYKSQNIKNYTGVDGHRLWLEDRLYGNHKLIREMMSVPLEVTFVPYYKEYMAKEFIPKRKEKNIHLKMLVDRNFKKYDTVKGLITNAETLKEVRQTNIDLSSSAECAMYGSKTSFYSLHNGQFMGVTIDDIFITNFMNKIYDALWENAEVI